MATPIPLGRESFIPHLVCSPCADALDFYKKAFGAEEVCRMPTPDGRRIMHAEFTVRGGLVFLADDFPEYCQGKSQTPTALGGNSVTIHRYVENCDAAISRAEKAGAKVTMPPQDMFWGDRYGVVTDPFGHTWSFATHKSEPNPEEIAAGAKAAFAQA